MEHLPLVSICIVCFNHEAYIRPMLESVKAQTYPRIELIISDDCSTDGSLRVAEAWALENKSVFQEFKILRSEKNTGVSSSCNRAWRAASGTYVKLISADDLLAPTYTEDMVSHQISSNADICFCYQRVFYPSDEKYIGTKYERFLEIRPAGLDHFSLPKDELYRLLLHACVFNAPTAFIKRDFLERVGGYDEAYPHVEDYPFWIKAVQNDAQIEFVDTYGVYYRKTPKSVSWRGKSVSSGTQSRFSAGLQDILDNICNPMLEQMGLPVRTLPQSIGEKSFLVHDIEMKQAIWRENQVPNLAVELLWLRSPSIFFDKLRVLFWDRRATKKEASMHSSPPEKRSILECDLLKARALGHWYQVSIEKKRMSALTLTAEDLREKKRIRQRYSDEKKQRKQALRLTQ